MFRLSSRSNNSIETNDLSYKWLTPCIDQSFLDDFTRTWGEDCWSIKVWVRNLTLHINCNLRVHTQLKKLRPKWYYNGVMLLQCCWLLSNAYIGLVQFRCDFMQKLYHLKMPWVCALRFLRVYHMVLLVEIKDTFVQYLHCWHIYNI